MTYFEESIVLKNMLSNAVYIKPAPEQVSVYGPVAMTATPGWALEEPNDPRSSEVDNNQIQLSELATYREQNPEEMI